MSLEAEYKSGIGELFGALKRRFNQLPPRERTTVFYGSITALLIIFYFAVLEPAWIGYKELRSELPALAERVQKYRSVIDVSEGSNEKRSSLQSQLSNLKSKCFEGQTPDIAAGGLVELARKIAAGKGISISSTKAGSPRKINGFEQINITIAFNATLAQLAELMHEVELSPKTVVIREAKIRSVKESYADTQPEALSIELTLAGLRRLP